ncbi:DUF6148 family protein [Roseibium aggregatum]|uniref:DUF6148 family protein n=1 Tax=Roseibium aggregatum TaxID=187304 RepID=UPI001E5953BD|nr:DUF6148 family protein [Roseibium aggregatum]UES51579.1 hypothetical protein GFK88_19355 [Roseibium aggregatum]
MAGLTAAIAQARLDSWLAADEAVAANQSYTINNRTLTRANAKEIRDNIDFWSKKIEELTARETRTRGPRYIVGA